MLPPASPPAAGSDGGAPADYSAADVAFVQQVLLHHQAAIDVCALAVGGADDPAVAALAGRITEEAVPQMVEAAVLLQQWGEPPAGGWAPEHDHEVHDDPGGAGDGQDEHEGEREAVAPVPGGSEEELLALTAATGADFDRLFLQLVLAQHGSLVELARTERSEGRSLDAVRLAGGVEAARSAEAETARELLGPS